MKKIDKWIDKIKAEWLFGFSAIPFFISGILFFQINGDATDALYAILGSLFSTITIYLWYKVYRKVNG
jgi:uncharacterized membrane protein